MKLDVRDGYVTIEGAARDYGVVVVGDPERDPKAWRWTRQRPADCGARE